MQLFNTLSRTIEPITVSESGTFSMYTCGLTVYSHPQIGNWVAYIYSDVLTRTLLHAGFPVKRVQNITDVGHLVSDDDQGEDKMEKGARAEGLTAWDVANKYIAIADHEAYEMLRLRRPDVVIRATELIDEQIDFVRQLEAKELTYVIDGEGVYFDTSKLTNYGKLAQLDINGLQAGARVEVSGKRNVTDFALWKFSPTDHKRDMEWDSPWGTGFPGWHLECSVIARHTLGDQVDLHTGGIDHIPVHHTNEIAQTESLTGKQFVRYWFHNNHIKIGGEKLAKSSGNSYLLQDIIDHGFSLDAFKVLVLSSHYRTEGNFSWDIMEAAQNRLKGWQQAADLVHQPALYINDNAVEELRVYHESFVSALYNDLDSPLALRIINEYFDVLVTSAGSVQPDIVRPFLKDIETLLGIVIIGEDINKSQQELITQRLTARQQKDWALADKLRDQLHDQGIGLNDSLDATTWFRL